MPSFGKRHLGHAAIIRAGGQPAVGRALIRTKAARDASGFAHRPLFQPIIKTLLRYAPPAAVPPVSRNLFVLKIARDRAMRPPDFRFQAIIKHKLPANVGSPQPIGKQFLVTRVSRDRAARPPDFRYHPMMSTFHPSGVQVIRWWIKT